MCCSLLKWIPGSKNNSIKVEFRVRVQYKDLRFYAKSIAWIKLLTNFERMYPRLINILSSALIIIFLLLIPESCSFTSEQPLLKSGHTGGLLKDIKNRGTLVALTDDNSFNYFKYDQGSYGYQYELLKLFADYLGVTLEIIVEPDVYKALQYLQQRRVDIIAMELPMITDGNFEIAYTTPLYHDYQVLVQRKVDHRSKSRAAKSKDYHVRTLEELKTRSINLPVNKQGQFYLSDIQHATLNEVNIVAESNGRVSDFVKNVSLGEIEYSIAYERTARALMLSYNNIDAHTRISPEIGVSWITRKGAVNLLDVANTWIEENKSDRKFIALQNKYFKNPRWVSIALGLPVPKKVISDYDNIIRDYSAKVGWDWRLVAALIYHESKFRLDATSHVGAFGLMQLMPATASRLGVHRGSTANEQIAAGIKLLSDLDKRFSSLVPDRNERKKFVLAAYNIGIAHILDARNLTEKYGKDPTIWSGNVEYFLLAKSKPEYYNDSVVKYGKISGRETHKFVLNVMDKYEQYKTLALR